MTLAAAFACLEEFWVTSGAQGTQDSGTGRTQPGNHVRIFPNFMAMSVYMFCWLSSMFANIQAQTGIIMCLVYQNDTQLSIARFNSCDNARMADKVKHPQKVKHLCCGCFDVWQCYIQHWLTPSSAPTCSARRVLGVTRSTANTYACYYKRQANWNPTREDSLSASITSWSVLHICRLEARREFGPSAAPRAQPWWEQRLPGVCCARSTPTQPDTLPHQTPVLTGRHRQVRCPDGTCGTDVPLSLSNWLVLKPRTIQTKPWGGFNVSMQKVLQIEEINVVKKTDSNYVGRLNIPVLYEISESWNIGIVEISELDRLLGVEENFWRILIFGRTKKFADKV